MQRSNTRLEKDYMIRRTEIATLILEKLQTDKSQLQSFYAATKDTIGYFFIDDLLPKKWVQKVHENFPDISSTKARKNIREFKHVAYQMNKYSPFLEEVIYAFQDERVVQLISEICGIQQLLPDENLYAGGLSLMAKNNYLNPHLDNSHDKDRNRWRVLNVLYYVTPNWTLENGGNLEVWPNGIKQNPITIESKCNRLVIMATHQQSWHSVSKVLIDDVRCCVSNYYFSKQPLLENDQFHITTFRGRPSQLVRDVLLQFDNSIRGLVRKIFKKGIRENPHQYKK